MSPKILLQYLLPHRLLSRLVFRATRWTWRPWKNALIRIVVRHYRVNLEEAAQSDIEAYCSFNAFFTRELADGVRQPPPPDRLSCPADGRVSQAGAIDDGRIFQAKGQDFSAAELLGETEAALPYRDGSFVTIYLAPRDYHRVHMPLDGTLQRTLHIPGRLFSVAPFTVAAVPRLFARNERLVCHFQGEHGPFAVVLVGAMLVSAIDTVWGGREIPPYVSRIRARDWRQDGIRLRAFEEMGRFNMGSTVIVLLPAGSTRIDPALTAETRVRLGDALGSMF